MDEQDFSKEQTAWKNPSEIKKFGTERIGEYKGLELWLSAEDYWVTKKDVAVHSFGSGSARNRIFIRREAYLLLSARQELLNEVLEHEYQEYLAWKGEAPSPHAEGGSASHNEVIEFLKANGY